MAAANSNIEDLKSADSCNLADDKADPHCHLFLLAPPASHCPDFAFEQGLLFGKQHIPDYRDILHPPIGFAAKTAFMTSIARLLRSVRRPRLTSVSFTAAILNINDPIEEQTLPRYCQQHYYPVHLGETFNDRYQVVAKLGYGASSTVWLARDNKSYVLRKVEFECLLLC